MALAVTQTDDHFDNSRPSTLTLTGANLGAAASDRIIAVGVGMEHSIGDAIVDAVTVAGVAATVVQSSQTNSTFRAATAFAYAAVPTGTSGDILVTFTGARPRSSMVVWSITGSDAAPHDFDGANYNSADVSSLNIDVEAGGAVLAIGFGRDPGVTAAWTGATDEVWGGTSNAIYEGASATGLSAETGRLIQVNWSFSLDCALSAISFSPSGGGGAPAPGFKPRTSIV